VFEGADKSAIINVVTEEIADDTKSILKEISQQLYGDGSGKKATVSAITSAASGILTFAGNGTSGLHIRGKYDIISGDASSDRDTNTASTQTAAVGTVLASAISVGAKTNSTATFGSYSGDTFTATDLTNLTISGVTTGDGGTILATDMVVPTGSYQKCISGLDYHINSGTGNWQNISRNTYPQFRAYTYSSVGDLTVAKLYKVIFQARYARRNDILEGEYVILSAPTQTHAYALLGDVASAGYNGTGADTNLTAMPAAGTLDYGFRSFKFAGINWIEDIDCPPDTLYVINFNKFKIHEFKPLSKVFDGNGFLPVPSFEANDYSSGAGSYTDNLLYTMTWKGQLVTKDPQMAGIKMTGLTTSGLALPTNDFAL
jgi:hypothetical protein